MDNDILSKIDIDSISDETLQIKELVTEAIEEIEKYKFLKSGNYKGIELSGEFEENLWVVNNEILENNVYFDFNRLNELRFKGVAINEINFIKCWVVNRIIEFKYEYEDEEENIKNEFRNVGQVGYEFSTLVKFIDASNNFSEKFLDTTKGSAIDLFLESYKADTYKRKVILVILNYIEFIEEIFIEEKKDIAIEYIEVLNQKMPMLSESCQPRKLPRSKNILLLGNYIEQFFYDKNIDEKLKLFYMPILIWWKLSTIIPMRPSEYTRKLKRNCLIKKNNDYYLKINRTKKKANIEYKYLPVLDKIKITKEVYDLIYTYIEKTEEFGKTETLFSYIAYDSIRRDIMPNMINEDLYLNNKNNINVFTRDTLSTLLKKFYRDVIYSIYKDTFIDEELLLGDTRHIAFTSLMLQDYSPVEIAIIGGHRKLSTLYNYTCSINTYIESEVITIIKNNMNIESKGMQKIADIIFNMPKECPVDIDKCVEAEIRGETIGYCTANYLKNPSPCENEECYECSKWWCEPTEYNYIALESAIKNKIKNKYDKLKSDIEFIKYMLKEIGLEVVDGQLVMDNILQRELERLSLDLKSNANDIIHLSYRLIKDSYGKYQLLNKLEDLLPVENVRDLLQVSSIMKI
ncbi:hypothetical protein [Paraclostridium sordellii]|uniref:hypothetical protein n=1 Tax=Paraclostridium sordellii TaxID=1505 RepID=UPI0030D452FD